ncbi:MAG: HAMP domain-containing sensor histidine kinase [Eubacteriales bacterium]|nr:HAMP domain-containing sensor histidine kinase [Eubacteriales bacterium]
MKISLKIFIVSYCLIMVLSVFGGFLIIHRLYRSDMERAMEDATDTMNMLQTYVITLDEIPNQSYANFSFAGFEQRLGLNKEGDYPPYIGDFSGWEKKIALKDVHSLEEGQVFSGIVETDTGMLIQVTSRLNDRYMIVYGDVKHVFEKRDANFAFYRNIIMISSVFVALVLLGFSGYIARPISKITKVAEQISEGDYDVRVDTTYRTMKSYEVQRLGETLNLLADSTKEYIEALKHEARKQEDFVGNFTHEIKTPLTSIIGYADLLRTGSHDIEKQLEYSNFIYREGKRLEQMALNLLQLFVMEKTDFELSRVAASRLFDQISSETRFLSEKYKVKIVLRPERAHIMAEPTLLIAMVVNLIDNACKAAMNGGSVDVIGNCSDKGYVLTVCDNGPGITEDQIDKIVEPFYMVDKSRARKQGGAGLGLALCSRIAKIHGTKLHIQSKENVGTRISVILKLCEQSEQPVFDADKLNLEGNDANEQ